MIPEADPKRLADINKTGEKLKEAFVMMRMALCWCA